MLQSPPTVADVLALPEVQAGQPVVLAGAAGLSRPVRWVHVLELSKVEGLLRGGELVLTTGVALPTSNDGLRRYVTALDRSGASGLLVQLGERWVTPPPALLAAAERVGLPVVGLPVEVPFVAITESVHSSLVSSTAAELAASERLYALFARRATDGSSPQQVVDDAAELAGAPVVLETLGHRVVAAALAGRDARAVLGDWERRSRRAGPSSAPPSAGAAAGAGAGEQWLTRPVAVRGQVFGRLVLLPGQGVRPQRLQVLAVERAAEALALARLLAGDGSGLLGRAHAGLLRELAAGRHRSSTEAHLRAAAAGVPTAGRLLTALAVAGAPGSALTGVRELARAVERAASRLRLPVLTAEEPATVAVLLPLPPDADVDAAVRGLADAAGAELRGPVVVGRGPSTSALDGLAASLTEAGAAARGGVLAGASGVVTLRDVGVHGLVAQLHGGWHDDGDGRLDAYVERSLGPLLDGTPASGALLRALRAFLEAGGNKSSAAAALHVSRPSMYARLDAVAQRLGVELDDATVRLSLHLALVALDARAALSARPGGAPEPP